MFSVAINLLADTRATRLPQKPVRIKTEQNKKEVKKEKKTKEDMAFPLRAKTKTRQSSMGLARGDAESGFTFKRAKRLRIFFKFPSCGGGV